MENQNRGDLHISGFGTSNGGTYNNVSISGGGNIGGDIECQDLRISGMGNIKGSVKAENAKISGTAGVKGDLISVNEVTVSGAADIDGDVKTKLIKTSGVCKIKGNLTSEELVVSGTTSVDKDVNTKKIKVSGNTHMRGNVHGEEIDIKGNAEIGGDCECEKFTANGGFKIGGLLNAGEIDIKIFYKCSVNEIGGEKITIRKSDGFAEIGRFIKNIFNIKEYLITQCIEGDDIYLESTVAKVVRGNNVTIGPDCEIDLVEYRNELKILNDTKVNKQEKIGVELMKKEI
jgi:cytoskeletal protein CcmA (bactofilin family)